VYFDRIVLLLNRDDNSSSTEGLSSILLYSHLEIGGGGRSSRQLKDRGLKVTFCLEVQLSKSYCDILPKAVGHVQPLSDLIW
jgi:hypothetical protein